MSLSQEESELSQDSDTSQFTASQRLSRKQSEKLGIPLFEFPLLSRKKAKLHPPLPNHLQPLLHLPLLKNKQWYRILRGHGQTQELLGWLGLYINFQLI